MIDHEKWNPLGRGAHWFKFCGGVLATVTDEGSRGFDWHVRVEPNDTFGVSHGTATSLKLAKTQAFKAAEKVRLGLLRRKLEGGAA